MKTFDWCPLFGSLPDCTDYTKWDGITENCIKIIGAARENFRILGSSWAEKKPDPEGIEKYTGFPASWIKAARLVCYNSREITYKARVWFLRSHAVTNRDGEEFMTVDVDQIDGRDMVRAIKQMVIFSGAGDWDITPGQAFSLMAIGEAWGAIRGLGNGKDPDDKQSAKDSLMRAEKLMKAGEKHLKEEYARENEEYAREMEKARPLINDGVKLKERRRKGGRAPKKAEGVLLWIQKILHDAEDYGAFNSIKAKGTWKTLRRKYTFDRKHTDFIDTDEMDKLKRNPYELTGTPFSFYFDGIHLIQVIAETTKHPEKTKSMTEKTFTRHFNTIKKSMLK